MRHLRLIAILWKMQLQLCLLLFTEKMINTIMNVALFCNQKSTGARKHFVAKHMMWSHVKKFRNVWKSKKCVTIMLIVLERTKQHSHKLFPICVGKNRIFIYNQTMIQVKNLHSMHAHRHCCLRVVKFKKNNSMSGT